MNEETNPANKKRAGRLRSGATLGNFIADCLLGTLQGTGAFQELQEEYLSNRKNVEAALVSENVRRQLARGIRAYCHLHLPALVRMLVESAQKGESWAWKILLDTTGIGEALRMLFAEGPAEEPGVAISSQFERDLLADVRELLLVNETKKEKTPDEMEATRT